VIPVLVAGAGPTGLMLALWLARRGIEARIVDKADAPGTTSRALVNHARTLEYYRQLGFADEAIARGIKFAAINLWKRGAHVARVALGDIGKDESPFPFMLILAQDELEKLLVELLEKIGVRVERSTELAGFEDKGSSVSAALRGVRGEETVECAWLIGCDGAHSTVREKLRLEFPGGTYDHMFYVADIHGKGPAINGELNLALDDADFLGIFPLPGEGNSRLIGTVKREAEAAGRKLEWGDVSPKVLERMRFQVERVNWFSTYHVHHRVVHRFRVGRVFVAGDAAHIHSPVGGQGMNTGIGDAVNLAWKLADVIAGRARESILDTYEPERIAFARRLVATTDRAFVFVLKNGPIARFVRLEIVPRVLPRLLAWGPARRFFFRTLSQVGIRYRKSALSAGWAGEVRGGDRLPWTPDDFAPLASLDWQAHVHGDAAAALRERCAALGIALQVFPWSDAARRAGFARDALYLVRPDGHVAFADTRADPAMLADYWQRTVSTQPPPARSLS